MRNKLKRLIISHDLSHVLATKKKYSEPKIMHFNFDLKRDWYVYFSFRNPETGFLQRMDNIYCSKTLNKSERLEYLKKIKSNLSDMLKDGFNPFSANENIEESKSYSIDEAFKFALDLKKEVLSDVSYSNFKNRIKKFEAWLNENSFKKRDINSINKKVINTYLNEVLVKTSARNRDNTRTDILGVFQVLEDNDIIPVNILKGIKIIGSKPKKNKSYSSTQEKSIFEYMEANDQLMLLFVKFVSYNFLRPVEVCRLKVEDIDLVDKTIRLQTKTDDYKVKILPQILIDDLPDLRNFDKSSFLFGRTGFGQHWPATENNRRNEYSTKFKEIKDKFGLGVDYGLYSFRHTFISKLYNVFIKEITPDEAESKLMLITGHSTRKALQQYLREIDAYRPEDYSKHL
ncbi:MAG: tyrosine-type recombinase/integrase [Flavobacteriaceae bacterium]|nr:tyrosine-type recombinase/integrase [Flavobacteriaceae bacterium]